MLIKVIYGGIFLSEKKNNLTSAKTLKRGYKNRRTKITKRCQLVLCGGWGAITLGIFAKFADNKSSVPVGISQKPPLNRNFTR